MVTPKSAQISAQANITVTSGENTDISAVNDFRVAAGESISLYTVNNEMKLVANNGQVKVQAQANTMDLIADKTLSIVSTEAKIMAAAEKEIMLTSGGAYIKITGGNIFLHAPGTIEHKAATYPHSGPTSTNYAMPNFVRAPICIECLKTAAENAANMLEA
ncbi:hypothetical protein B6D06_01750 [Gilliamella apis]|uniref:DUF2345 domain-containing protein n=2 Tax=Gilliamella apis TaxID=1970738 RepID=A0A242NWQ9_9GAMM|nr:hypothetical protein B6D06_01750 [Gilliamella apis]